MSRVAQSIEDLVFVAFNSHVSALDRMDGQIIWTWKCPKGQYGGFMSLLLDGDRLIASAYGYTYCLEPLSGRELWYQEFKGMGVGHACLASVRGTASLEPALARVLQQQHSSHTSTIAAGS